MPRSAIDISNVLAVVAARPGPMAFGEIYEALETSTPPRTIQSWLKRLVDDRRLQTTGSGRWVRYSLTDGTGQDRGPRTSVDSPIQLTEQSKVAQRYVRQAQALRKPVGYDRKFLENYRPNQNRYFTDAERERLAGVGEQGVAAAAGTYAKQILTRLLVDLSWNSSRLEGNTYSLGDTERLIEFGQAAEGLGAQDTQMILNHKDAIEFLVNSADEIGLDSRTIQNLHALLANNLLPDTSAEGRLRFIPVGIGGSVFHPLEGPQLIQDGFAQLLATAAAINDPFEQAFFLMVQLPYLQPFDDVNKRVSRLAANIPFIRGNLSPLSFTDVPVDLYLEAMLAIYELQDVNLLKDLFLWAYERSAQRYRAVRQSLGEPDPLKLKYRDQLREIVARIIRGRVGRESVLSMIEQSAANDVSEDDRAIYTKMVETELANLHEGNFARYRVRPSEFDAWHAIWHKP